MPETPLRWQRLHGADPEVGDRIRLGGGAFGDPVEIVRVTSVRDAEDGTLRLGIERPRSPRGLVQQRSPWNAADVPWVVSWLLALGAWTALVWLLV